VYLLNRSPHKGINNALPEEVWTGKRVDHTQIKVFGCNAYVHVPGQIRRGKLSPKSKRLIFVGYDSEKKGYRLFDPSKPKQIFVEHSFVFDEKRFTKAESVESTNCGDLSELIYYLENDSQNALNENVVLSQVTQSVSDNR